jgi:hypothetical protein
MISNEVKVKVSRVLFKVTQILMSLSAIICVLDMSRYIMSGNYSSAISNLAFLLVLVFIDLKLNDSLD